MRPAFSRTFRREREATHWPLLGQRHCRVNRRRASFLCPPHATDIAAVGWAPFSPFVPPTDCCTGALHGVMHHLDELAALARVPLERGRHDDDRGHRGGARRAVRAGRPARPGRSAQWPSHATCCPPTPSSLPSIRASRRAGNAAPPSCRRFSWRTACRATPAARTNGRRGESPAGRPRAVRRPHCRGLLRSSGCQYAPASVVPRAMYGARADGAVGRTHRHGAR